MNQQIIFNQDFQLSRTSDAVCFSCLVSGFKFTCFIRKPKSILPQDFLQQVKAAAFSWEDSAEQAIANDAYNEAGEIWL